MVRCQLQPQVPVRPWKRPVPELRAATSHKPQAHTPENMDQRCGCVTSARLPEIPSQGPSQQRHPTSCDDVTVKPVGATERFHRCRRALAPVIRRALRGRAPVLRIQKWSFLPLKPPSCPGAAPRGCTGAAAEAAMGTGGIPSRAAGAWVHREAPSACPRPGADGNGLPVPGVQTLRFRELAAAL